MKNHEVIVSLAWVVIGAIVCVASFPLRLGAWRLPGPGLFPFLIGAVIVLFSLCHGIIELFKEPQKFRFWPDPAGLKRILALFISLLFYAGTLRPLGYPLCTFLFFMMVFKIVSQKSWKLNIPTSLTITIVSYVVFHTFLKINLPKGFLGL